MTHELPDTARLCLEPIGYVRCELHSKIEAARQPRAASGVTARIELLPGRDFQHALEDLAGWEYVWVIFWFHLNPAWRPKVLPPRSQSGRKGVFSTRSPHRPNPLGLSVVRLEHIEGLTLHVRDVDMLDGTPVLDLKPYVAYSDALPHARSGWLEDAASAAAQAPDAGAAPSDPLAAWPVRFYALATRKAAWIEQRTQLALRQRIEEILSMGPEPHAYRRIRRDGDALRLAIKEWRMRCTVTGREIQVLDIASGYRASQLATAPADAEPFKSHRDFQAEFPSTGAA